VEDLLGREPVSLDTAGISHMVRDKVVLVTGAGGSIGSELCRQIADCNPARLLLVEQSEPAMFVIEQELNARGMGAIIQPVIADVVDRSRIVQILSRYKPALIFHAAAHKHVYMMERQPAEALKNNSLGTLLLAEEAVAHGVETFLAYQPTRPSTPRTSWAPPSASRSSCCKASTCPDGRAKPASWRCGLATCSARRAVWCPFLRSRLPTAAPSL
jgi:hypothetical protein